MPCFFFIVKKQFIQEYKKSWLKKVRGFFSQFESFSNFYAFCQYITLSRVRHV